MGFSGKPSKGCQPCRERRTRCDLALPSCGQCLRKNRICSGYRKEQDLLFRNETTLVERKVRRKHGEQGDASPSLNSFAAHFAGIHRPSRRAALHDEAVLHYFAHYNEKFYSSSGAIDYLLPIYQADAVRGGPVSEIVSAAGLAALGNMKGAPDLLNAARAKQVKVLRQLNQQLQDPKTALSDSSVMTCILLSTFETCLADGEQSAVAQTIHMKGAAKLIELRGRSQLNAEVGRGLYVKVRGAIMTNCLRMHAPFPDFMLNFQEEEDVSQRNFEPKFYKLQGKLAKLRSEHKMRGVVDEDMAKQAQFLMDEFTAWRPSGSAWEAGQRPSAETLSRVTSGDETYRLIWLATLWIFQQTARIQASDILIDRARAQHQLDPSSAATATVDNAVNVQVDLCEQLRDGVEYYLDNIGANGTAMRTIGGYILMWPLSVLLAASTRSGETFIWTVKQAERISEVFSIRQGKAMADYINIAMCQATIASTATTSAPSGCDFAETEAL